MGAASPAVETVPISIGTSKLAIPALDKVMIGYVQKINCTAGTLAISRRGRLLYERGYGWLDRQHKIAAPASAFFGIASCEKPITAAAVRKLAAEGKLNLESPLFSTLGIQPAGSIVDWRVTNITFEEVLEHKAGWGGDIGDELTGLARAAGGRPPFTIPVLLAQVMSRPLQDEPGAVYQYSNFGFDTMRFVVEHESGVTPGTYYRERLLQKSKCQEVGQPQDLTRDQQTNRAVWNVRAEGRCMLGKRSVRVHGGVLADGKPGYFTTTPGGCTAACTVRCWLWLAAGWSCQYRCCFHLERHGRRVPVSFETAREPSDETMRCFSTSATRCSRLGAR